MREDVSRRKALSMLGIALGLGLALTDAEAQTTGTKSHHTKHPKRPTVQPAAAPAEAAPAEFKPTTSQSQAYSHAPSEGRPPLHPGDKQQ
jgi:hypothetical protein